MQYTKKNDYLRWIGNKYSVDVKINIIWSIIKECFYQNLEVHM